MTEIEREEKSLDIAKFGFWVYLMTDLLMFAVLFATFAVLRGSTFGGSSQSELVDLTFVFAETMILLTSSFSVGIAIVEARKKNLRNTLVCLIMTFVLGFAFLSMEIYEFHNLIKEGHSWTSSASMSSFFALVGTHGLHIAVGLFWLIFIIGYTYKRGITPLSMRKLTLFSLFWHFLDIVWIFIFTIVYLMGAAL